MKRSPFKRRGRKVTERKALERKADKLWSQYIVKRDKSVCQKCRKKGNNPHHIFTRSIKHLRHSPDNGICLCAGCHTLGLQSAHKGPEAFRDWLIGHKGLKWYENLKLSANIPAKPDYNAAIMLLERLLDGYVLGDSLPPRKETMSNETTPAGVAITPLLSCDGSCEEHHGTVRPVECWGAYDREPWRFNYCDEAVAEDTRRGFRVVEA